MPTYNTLREAYEAYGTRPKEVGEYLTRQGWSASEGDSGPQYTRSSDGDSPTVRISNEQQGEAKDQMEREGTIEHYAREAGYMAYGPEWTPTTEVGPDYKKMWGVDTVDQVMKRVDPGGHWAAPGSEENPFDSWAWKVSPQYQAMESPDSSDDGFGTWAMIMGLGFGALSLLASAFPAVGAAGAFEGATAAGAVGGEAASGGLIAGEMSAGVGAGDFALTQAGSGVGIGGQGTAGLGLQVPAASNTALLSPSITGGATGIGAAGLETGATAGGLGIGATAPSGAPLNNALLSESITGGATGIGAEGLPVGTEVQGNAATASGINAPASPSTPAAPESRGLVDRALEHVTNNPVSSALTAANLATSLGGGSPTELERTGTAAPSASSDFRNTNLGVAARPGAVLRDRNGNPVFRPGGGLVLSNMGMT